MPGAVADLHVVRLSGLPAWITWLAVHLFHLVGFRNRLLVLLGRVVPAARAAASIAESARARRASSTWTPHALVEWSFVPIPRDRCRGERAVGRCTL